MKRLFIDSSVLFTAAYSEKGYARDLILAGIRLAAARLANVGALVTLDKRHLLGRPELEK